MLKDLILKNRSYRRFYQDEKISLETLKELIDLARLSPSARNMQPLKFYLSWEKEKNNTIFPHFAWAGYLKDWDGPEEGERPSAYIIILLDKNITDNNFSDHCVAAQSILLGAVEKGLGGCMIGSIKRTELKQVLNLPEEYDILLCIALGKPRETIVLDPVGEEGDINYWRDENEVHHVPKRDLEDLLVY